MTTLSQALIANAFERGFTSELPNLFTQAADRGVKPETNNFSDLPKLTGIIAYVLENDGGNFVLLVDHVPTASATHPQPLLDYAKHNGLTLIQPIPSKTVKSPEPFGWLVIEPGPEQDVPSSITDPKGPIADPLYGQRIDSADCGEN